MICDAAFSRPSRTPFGHATTTQIQGDQLDQRMVGQAVPSLVPPRAAAYFHKTECFCFEQQVLEPGELLEMPMRFIISSDLPKNVQSVSLGYELFDVTSFAAHGAGNEG